MFPTPKKFIFSSIFKNFFKNIIETKEFKTYQTEKVITSIKVLANECRSEPKAFSFPLNRKQYQNFENQT